MSKFLTRLKNWMTSDGGKAFMKTLAKLLIGAAAGASGATCFTGCSSFVPDSKTQSMEVYALGLPAIAVIKSSPQTRRLVALSSHASHLTRLVQGQLRLAVRSEKKT